jgi:arabinan endo-1,5-alpha-L-arabinosidase
MLQTSTIARFSTAMFISFLITTATFLPLIAHLTYAVPVAQGAPQALESPPSGLYPDPQPCYGNCSWIHDPSIVYEDGTYWRFSTSGNIAIATAPSLSGPWTYQGALLTNGTKIHIQPDQDIWVCIHQPSTTSINITNTHARHLP